MTTPTTHIHEPTAEQVDTWYAISARATELKGASDHAHAFAALAYQAGHAAALAELRAGGVKVPKPNYYIGDGFPYFSEERLEDYGDRRAAAVVDKRLKVKLGSQYGADLAGHWFYLHPADECAAKTLDKRHPPTPKEQTP